MGRLMSRARFGWEQGKKTFPGAVPVFDCRRAIKTARLARAQKCAFLTRAVERWVPRSKPLRAQCSVAAEADRRCASGRCEGEAEGPRRCAREGKDAARKDAPKQ